MQYVAAFPHYSEGIFLPGRKVRERKERDCMRDVIFASTVVKPASKNVSELFSICPIKLDWITSSVPQTR